MDETKKIIEIGFRKWRMADVQSKLKVKRIEIDTDLDEWLKVSGEIAPEYQLVLQKFRKKLSDSEGSWNEFDLIGSFVGPLFALVDFCGEYYNGFYHRHLSATFENGDTIYEAAGFVDWMAASGIAEPECPYFFPHRIQTTINGQKRPVGTIINCDAGRSTTQRRRETAVRGVYYWE